MEKEEMLSAIYDEMSDKTLSEGCTILNKISGTNDIVGSIGITVDDRLFLMSFDDYMGKDEYTIIGHPVLIGDVIEYIRLKNIWDINPITDEWDYPRLSIEEQSDECIEFVYNLIKK